MASRVDERSRSAVNSVFTQRTDDESSQYDSSEDSDEEGQMPNNIKGSDSFIISFTDECIDTVTVSVGGGTAAVSADSDSAVVSGSTSKSTGISLQEAFKRFKKKKQVGEVYFDIFFSSKLYLNSVYCCMHVISI